MKPHYKLHLDGRREITRRASSFETMISRLREAYGAKDSADLRSHLGTSFRTYLVWKSRGKVSNRALHQASIATGKSIGYFTSGATP